MIEVQNTRVFNSAVYAARFNFDMMNHLLISQPSLISADINHADMFGLISWISDLTHVLLMVSFSDGGIFERHVIVKLRNYMPYKQVSTVPKFGAGGRSRTCDLQIMRLPL